MFRLSNPKKRFSEETHLMFQQMEPVFQLTQGNMQKLTLHDYVVGPKADGERMLLLCEAVTNAFYLICKSAAPRRLQGLYDGPTQEGFLLEAEVVVSEEEEESSSNSMMILVFDIICVGSEIIVPSLCTKYSADVVGLVHKCLTIKSLDGRRSLLRVLVASMSIPGLWLKPVAPAENAANLWKGSWRYLPYRIDGVVFSPKISSTDRPVFKWKPAEEMTLDVAVSNILEQTPSGSRFIAYLRSQDDAKRPNFPIASPSEVTHPGHSAFFLSGHRTVESKEYRQDDFTPDIMFAHRKDLECIARERKDEAHKWHRGSMTCNLCDCPCGEWLPCSLDRKIQHCFDCGALGVHDIGDEERSFCCISCDAVEKQQCLDCGHYGIYSTDGGHSLCCPFCIEDENRSLPHTPKGQSLWIPNNVATWARHSIVEVEFINCMQLKYKRLRRDKQVANSFSVAEEIIQNHWNPISLSELCSRSDCPKHAATEHEKADSNYRGSCEDGRSTLRALRKRHRMIKGWLYETYGGSRIIDACSGALHDLDTWIASDCIDSVLAIEQDKELHDRGLKTIQSKVDTAKITKRDFKISSIRGDLKLPLDGIIQAAMGGHQANAVFCNFAIHYLWDSPEQFLTNLVPLLLEGGHFVVTYLQGEHFRDKSSIQIYNDEGGLEFEGQRKGQKLDIFISSIGVRHEESIVVKEEIVSRFEGAGLKLISWLPFDKFGSILSADKLGDHEAKMSSFYAAAVFKKHEKLQPAPFARNLLFSHEVPPGLEQEILSFLSIPDLVRCRELSTLWLALVEDYQVPNRTKEDYFGVNGGAQNFRYHYRSKLLTPSSIALYLHLGGSGIKTWWVYY